MSVRASLKRSAVDDIGILSKKFRIRTGNNSSTDLGLETDHKAVNSEEDDDDTTYSPALSSATTPYAQSEVDTEITHPSPRNDRPTYRCPYDGCDKVYKRPCRLEDHIRSHTNEKPFVCPYDGCGKAYGRDTYLNHHVNSTHTDKRNFTCQWEGCGKSFHTGQRLKVHQQFHENAERFRCTDYPPCNQSFRKHKTLQAHVSLVHLNKKPYPCSHIDETTGKSCEYGYETASKLESHMKRVHGGELYHCTLCDNMSIGLDDDGASFMSRDTGFKTYHALQVHIKDQHPPVCQQCNMAFSSLRELRSHIDLQHNDEPIDDRRLHVCHDCGKSFTKMGNLKVHINTVHRNERKYVCKDVDFSDSKHPELAAWNMSTSCEGSFKTKQQLENHVRTEHLGYESSWTARKKKKFAQGGAEHTQTRKSVPLLDTLTGTGYEEHRPIACLRSTCDVRFLRHYDLLQHCSAKHGMADVEIADAVRERDALAGGQFWLGGIDPGHEPEGFQSWPIDPALDDSILHDPLAPQRSTQLQEDEDFAMADAVLNFLNND